jgi:small subunit ribosomal protein S16
MIRLSRVGARKQPHYRVVVIEKDRARNGRSIEVVGSYNPRTNPATVDLKTDRVEYWSKNGAQMSDIVAKLVKKYTPKVEGDPAPDKRTSHKPESKKPVAAAEPEAVAPVAEAPVAEPEVVAEPAVSEPAAEPAAEPEASVAA